LFPLNLREGKKKHLNIKLIIHNRYQGTAEFTRMDLQTEFQKFSEVVVNMGEYIGSTGRVTGYANNNFPFDDVEVKITKTVPNFSNITREIASKYDSQYNYRSVQGVALFINRFLIYARLLNKLASNQLLCSISLTLLL